MHATLFGERQLTRTDLARLRRLAPDSIPDQLAELLDEAEICDPWAVPVDTVTLDTPVQVEDAGSGRRTILTVCEPAHSEPAVGRISVLSPAGVALLGLRAGSVARWMSPAGHACDARVIAVPGGAA